MKKTSLFVVTIFLLAFVGTRCVMEMETAKLSAPSLSEEATERLNKNELKTKRDTALTLEIPLMDDSSCQTNPESCVKPFCVERRAGPVWGSSTIHAYWNPQGLQMRATPNANLNAAIPICSVPGNPKINPKVQIYYLLFIDAIEKLGQITSTWDVCLATSPYTEGSGNLYGLGVMGYVGNLGDDFLAERVLDYECAYDVDPGFRALRVVGADDTFYFAHASLVISETVGNDFQFVKYCFLRNPNVAARDPIPRGLSKEEIRNIINSNRLMNRDLIARNGTNEFFLCIPD